MTCPQRGAVRSQQTLATIVGHMNRPLLRLVHKDTEPLISAADFPHVFPWITQQKPEPSVRVQIKTKLDDGALKSFSKASWTVTDGQNEQTREPTQKSR